MGSLRRRLIAAGLIAPQPALAGVCDGIRPGWIAAKGAQTAAAETAYILTSPLGVVILLLLAAALIFPRRWLAVVAVLPVLGFGGLLAIGRQSEASVQAMAEGCIGTALPALLILGLLAIVAVARAFGR